MTYKFIMKELAILIKEKHKSCTTEKEKNRAVNEARQEINNKYGSDWRSLNPAYIGYSEPSIYDEHTFGEHWMTD